MKINKIATLATALSIAVLAMTPTLVTANTRAKPAAATKSKVKFKSRSRSKSNVQRAATAAAVVTAVALTPEALAVADRVQVGHFPCELGASVTLSADSTTPGYFNMQGKNFNYRMAPVTTSTGAVRLEDPKAGVVWLQLGNKSMLMNQKQGLRLADECMSPKQVMVAQALKSAPAVDLLDAAKSSATVPAAGR